MLEKAIRCPIDRPIREGDLVPASQVDSLKVFAKPERHPGPNRVIQLAQQAVVLNGSTPAVRIPFFPQIADYLLRVEWKSHAAAINLNVS